MRSEARPAIVTVEEFSDGAFRPDRPVLVHYSDEEFARITRDLKPAPFPAHGPGLYVIPLPGPAGYLAIPMCGPGEVPHIRPDGSVRCVPSEFEDPSEPREEVPDDEEEESGCRLRLDEFGIPHCVGSCDDGGPCRRSFSILGIGYFLSCHCLFRVERISSVLSA